MKRSHANGWPGVGALFFLTIALPIALPVSAQVARGDRSDPHLLAALRADPELTAKCAGCIRAVTWRDESYARIAVDPARWRALGSETQRRFAARALSDVETIYLSEWGAPDLYNAVFIVDQRGRLLAVHPPVARQTL